MARKLFRDQLRQAVLQCGKTRYRISIETGIAQSILSRFLNHGAGLSLANVEKLCACIGAHLILETSPAKRRSTKKGK